MFSYIHVYSYWFMPASHATSRILDCCCCRCCRLQWKAVGDAGFAARVEHNIELAQHLEACVAAAGDKFLMAVPRVAANVCFWCVPPCILIACACASIIKVSVYQV
jgi:hypothetical protein